MHIRASIPGFKQIDLNLNPNRTIKDLNRLACHKLGIEPELTKLLQNGKQLKENRRISDLKPKAPITVDYLWSRQLLVWGAEGQSTLRTATVLLAGAGAIGNEAAKNLAMLGVGKILIADRDRVEMSNVSRMIFFQPKDLGKNKAEALAENLHRKYPYVATSAYRGNLESMPLKFYLDSQVVISGLDNAVSRIFLTQTSRKYSIPLVDAGIIGLTGRVHSYVPPNQTCPICLFPPNQYSNIVGLRNPCEAPADQPTVPSFATSISLVSSILSQEAIKILLGHQEYHATKKWPERTGQPLNAILFIDLKNNRYSPMNLARNPRCIVCGKDGTARETATVGQIELKTLSKRKPTFEDQIREASQLGGGTLRIYLENSHGTRKIDHPESIPRAAKPGNYLRIMVETKNGELRESILRLL
jgi:molybdopterin/thiamine biosynthesis adenylyltransferase